MRGDIVVVNYHKGNLQSVVRGVNAAGGHAFASDEPADIDRAAAVILPGVGAFEDAMAYMRQSGQADAIVGRIGAGVPFLGICLGLHLLFQRGAERSAGHRGNGEWVGGLGVLEGSVARLESSRLKVPHVGWDQAHLTEHGRRCPLFVDVPEGANVYFTHSYATTDDIDGGIVAATTHYACSFASGVWKDNVFGVQFHPEKSSHAGMRILSNFVNVARG
ncbi:imidazole glycerol phosphate synthase subunit hisH [Olsenella uli DSM 7084]|uniref:Imidazole glycerol phosphate synthase subunit HisH n=1 Tax=Olsenella uli (strain ATCC 49627 / DSM 7084 / CCUG 31166 / CIP 109912 / JCM 12494 / LMG 11480 / NCIMB 702895 / VPI D76D-27C) TaxID=633147 RepID=E1QWA0_OLSUV|nr:imidazole glycerol phosphate synthase subunit HisH [Olsenella uli]ADK68403.1 imidazole glycerol phosphate synthase subunit hisH [Olsenella uli DSM 7084]